MHYNELIQFDPIETTIQLIEADDKSKAKKLVSTYVISDDMALNITKIAFEQLQFDHPMDNKGLLIVGNYGTGKSHLMSVISSIAEYEDMVDSVQNKAVSQEAAKIAGKFKVTRIEIGSTTRDFRDIICSELSDALSGWNIEYHFPDRDKITNHKQAFEEMMAVFHSVYPEKGLLLVVDELLDYLRQRKMQELVRDLGFLREIGEVCKNLRFRFIAGVQEAIFDTDSFSFVSDSIKRVKDRFEQVLIAKKDVKFVVSQRLLQKSAKQKAQIAAYLSPFAKFYEQMNERMADYVELFPIHPEYIDTFEKIRAIEKREVLRTFSNAMKEILNNEIPTDYPGIIAYDAYWKQLKENAAFRSIPDIRTVIECSDVLESKVEQSFSRPPYKKMALRIIQGISVNRLATGDIYQPLGLTAKLLRDELCLFQPGIEEMGGEPDADLQTLVETVLREIIKTVNGQFISMSQDSGQYYLDLKKDVDYDALIAKRAEILDKNKLDLAYFDALSKILERSDTYHPGTHLAWEYELQWLDRKAARIGYMFFGTPNERSTAQPPRDFYLYFIQVFEAPPFKDELRSDEAFIKLTHLHDELQKHIRYYAAAQALASTSSGQAKTIYLDKARGFLKDIVQWLNKNMLTAVELKYQGKSKSILEWLKGSMPSSEMEQSTVRDLLNTAGSISFSEYFKELAPEYPYFSIKITGDNRQQAAIDALRGIGGSSKTKQGTAVLDALELLQGEKVDLKHSKYATFILELLDKKGAGQVMNRSELIQNVMSVEYMLPERFRLEPEWVIVLLAAMVYAGDIVFHIPGKEFSATDIAAMSATPLHDLVGFKHIKKPKDMPIGALKALFELLDLAPGLAVELSQGKDGPVEQLQKSIALRVEQLVMTAQKIQSGIPFWGKNLLSENEINAYRQKMEETKTFLESIQAFNTPGKMKNFKYSSTDVKNHGAGLAKLDEVAALQGLVADLGVLASYLAQAEAFLPDSDAWISTMKTTRDAILVSFHDPEKRTKPEFRQTTLQQLNELQQGYMDIYTSMHQKARLGVNDDNRKKALSRDERLEKLKKLATISTMHASQLVDFQNRLGALTPCYSFMKNDLNAAPLCPHCSFKPSQESIASAVGNRLSKLEDDLDRLYDEWTNTLLNNLEDPITQERIDLLKPEMKKHIEDFLKKRALPDELSNEFVQAIREALSDLKKITIKVPDLKDALLAGGSPFNPSEMKSRLDTYLGQLTAGKDPGKVRIVLE
ncbi:MAG: DUF6079 family protein [Desulfobacterales bacterium]|nr:DUF6079 family protein [Desulfobacterales bacterium]